MTRGEKAEQIYAALKDLAGHPSFEIVGFILAELEAVGMQWDPKEPALPERLTRGFAGGSSCLWPLGTGGWQGYSPQAIEKTYDEAARRFNVLPQVECAFRRWQKADYGSYVDDDNFAGTIEWLLKEGS